MKLSQFLDLSQKTISQAAQEIGVSPEAVRYWLNGERRPSHYLMTKIYIWSGGQITPNDFHELPSLPRRSFDRSGESAGSLQEGSLRMTLGGGAGMCASGNDSAMPALMPIIDYTQQQSEVCS